MKIENYNRKFAEEKEYGDSIISNSHVICGFKMRLIIYLNGSGDGYGTYMSVYFQLMKGEFDDCLEWPFDKIVSVVLIHQDNKDKCHKLILSSAQETKLNLRKGFLKPKKKSNTGYGFNKFITLEKLHAGGFIKNDILYLRCDIY